MTTMSKTVVHLTSKPFEDFSGRVPPTARNVQRVHIYLHKIFIICLRILINRLNEKNR